MSSICSSTLTSGFIDLATLDEIEKYLYGGPKATAYFVRETRRSTWFTQVPVVLSRASGTPAFDQEFSVNVSRAGDYVLQSWLRVTTPQVTVASNANYRIRWCKNFMHNLIKECCISFNDLIAARFDNYHLDFWAAFTVPESKRNGYNNMIGNFDAMTAPRGLGVTLPDGSDSLTIDSYTLNLPLPLFYTRDSGVGLPVAALPYNEIRITFSLRSWRELLIFNNLAAAAGTDQRQNIVVGTHITTEPVLGNTQVWSNYAIVSNDERRRMGCAPRDILIEQVQTAPRQSFTPATNTQQSFDLRFSNAVKCLFFAVRNSTWVSEWSIYTTNSPILEGGANSVVNYVPYGSSDPILQTSILYENTNRIAQMGSDYFSLVNPFYHAVSIPNETGLHMYSYALDLICLDPTGSTNFGKLTNVSIVPEASDAAVVAANGTGSAGLGADFAQRYEFITTCVSQTIVRVSGGAFGFPVM